MIPVNVITGFLGSGKTTLLREVLADPSCADSAVIINEFGEVGLDHLLVEEIEEGVLLLESGCICCTIRSDLQDTIRSLQKRVAAGAIKRFDRLFIETTGIADPAPIASTLIADPLFRSQFRLGNIICLVDATSGLEVLGRHAESRKQIVVADRLLVSKTDMVASESVQALEQVVRNLNPAALVSSSTGRSFNVAQLIAEDLGSDIHRTAEIRRWIEPHEPKYSPPARHHGHAEHGAHGITSFVMRYDQPIDWIAFGIWLTALLHAHGTRVLRVKGILHVRESRTPVIIHGVQHVVHPPMHLEQWPDEDRSSKIVFITLGISEAVIRESLDRLMNTARHIRGGNT